MKIIKKISNYKKPILIFILIIVLLIVINYIIEKLDVSQTFNTEYFEVEGPSASISNIPLSSLSGSMKNNIDSDPILEKYLRVHSFVKPKLYQDFIYFFNNYRQIFKRYRMKFNLENVVSCSYKGPAYNYFYITESMKNITQNQIKDELIDNIGLNKNYLSKILDEYKDEPSANLKLGLDIDKPVYYFDIDLTKNKNTDAKYITINWEVNKLGRMTEIRKNILYNKKLLGEEGKELLSNLRNFMSEKIINYLIEKGDGFDMHDIKNILASENYDDIIFKMHNYKIEEVSRKLFNIVKYTHPNINLTSLKEWLKVHKQDKLNMIRFKENSKYGMKINIHTIPEINKQLNIIHKKFRRKSFDKMMDENNFFTKDNYKKIQRWNNTLLKELPLQQL